MISLFQEGARRMRPELLFFNDSSTFKKRNDTKEKRKCAALGEEEEERGSRELLFRLKREHRLSLSEYEYLLRKQSPAAERLAAELAREERERVYGREIYGRGLIEFTNFCKNGCRYCGINRENRELSRYRLSPEEILSCCEKAHHLGLRTFVLQGGEDPYFTDERMQRLIRRIRASFPDCAITLSIGERSRKSYRLLRNAGAERYLLRHETADEAHYALLHPPELSLRRRMRCLLDLKELGYQVGCGFMVGSPGQSSKTMAEDLCFIQDFRPDMCGIGPFIPQHTTIFRKERAGGLHQTLYLLSLLRLIQPNLLLPATTALETIHPRGWELGILAGANVIMPNLSPVSYREQYALYDNKPCEGEEFAHLKLRMEAIGYELVEKRGDIKKQLPTLPNPMNGSLSVRRSDREEDSDREEERREYES